MLEAGDPSNALAKCEDKSTCEIVVRSRGRESNCFNLTAISQVDFFYRFWESSDIDIDLGIDFDIDLGIEFDIDFSIDLETDFG